MSLRTFSKKILYGGIGRTCPICTRPSRRFRSFGDPRRRDALCGWCSSLERHRLLWLYLDRRTSFFRGPFHRILHVAPESCLEPRFRAHFGRSYVTTAYGHQRADVLMDVTKIAFADGTFDFICCSHVLEHIVDDFAAMREFRRVLKPGGLGVFLVPVGQRDATAEDPAITSPSERRRLYGQRDHVRLYGADFPQRLTDSGFSVERVSPSEVSTPEEAATMGLGPAAGDIYACRR